MILGSVGLTAACGSSGHPPSAARPAAAATDPTRPAFIDAADRICRRLTGHIRALGQNLEAAVLIDATNDTGGNRATAGVDADNEILLDKQQLARISALAPPSPDHNIISEFVAANASEIQTLEQLGRAIDDDSVLRAASVSQQLTASQARVARLAERYGFTVCGIPNEQ